MHALDMAACLCAVAKGFVYLVNQSLNSTSKCSVWILSDNGDYRWQLIETPTRRSLFWPHLIKVVKQIRIHLFS